MRSSRAANPRPARSNCAVPSASRRALRVRIRPIGLWRWCRWTRRRRLRHGRLFTRRGGPAVLAAVNPGPLDPARIGIEHFGLERLRSGHQFAAHRNMAGADDQITAEGVDLLCGVTDVELIADDGADVVEAGAAVGEKRAVALPHDGRHLAL